MDQSGKRKLLPWSILGALIILAALVYVFGRPALANYYFSQGVKAFNAANYDAAKNNFNRSLLVNAKNSKVYFYFGKIALGEPQLGQNPLYPKADYNTAIANYQKAVDFQIPEDVVRLPKIGTVHFHSETLKDLGFSYWMLKNYQKADDIFLKEIELYPAKAFFARLFVGTDFFSRFNKPKEALDILLPSANATGAAALYKVKSLVARLYLYSGDMANAEKYANMALSVAGKNIADVNVQAAHNVLAQVYGSRGAFDLVKTEVKKANDFVGVANYYDCVMAQAFLRGKNYVQAIKVASAKKLRPQPNYVDSFCLSALAESFFAQGNSTKAKMYFTDYLGYTGGMEPKNIFIISERARAEELLKSL